MKDVMSATPDSLPLGLPVPEDDGAAQHLLGRALPAITLASTDGSEVKLDTVSEGRWVMFVYPMTGEPGVDSPDGWDDIPGARGCSQEACSFRDNLAALQALGVGRVLALSSDRLEHQQALIERFHLPYPMLSDPGLLVAAALDLPTFSAAAATFYKRLTLVVDASRIAHVFYPIFPPDTHADEVVDWLRGQTGRRDL